MFKKIFLLISFLGSLVASAQVDIAVARTYAEGTANITIEGIVLNGQELGPIRYIQDATAALPVYDPTITSNWNTGDHVTLTATMSSYQGLIQLITITDFTVNSTNNTLPAPLELTQASAVGTANESQLIQVKDATFADAGMPFGVGTYTFSTQDGSSSLIYIRSGHPLVGTTVPLSAVNITGISSTFSGTAQLLPRSADDFEIADDFYIADLPQIEAINKDGFTLTWQTNTNGTSGVHYGLTPSLELGSLTNDTPATSHEFTLTGLDAGQIYYVQAFSENSNGNTVSTPVQILCTESNSSGQMLVYFNHLADVRVATSDWAIYLPGPEMEQEIINYINNAESTIDIAMYNNNRYPLVEALNAAVARGVQVRYVYDAGTLNEALQTVTPDFPTLGGNADNLMHNKFMIIDAENVDKCWVMGGSMNWTDVNIGDDYNNTIFIQDQGLARTYRLEFEEMWGSTGASPGIFGAKFGSQKTANTPTQLKINGINVEVYFSPTDAPTNALVNEVNAANNSLYFEILSFTKDELGTAIAQAYNRGVMVEGILENQNDQGSEFDFLANTVGVDLLPHTPDYQIHHKFMIADTDNANSDPTIATGSFNWSNSAENNNDENLLVIHDQRVSNLYYQEFVQRWCELTGGADCYTALPIFAQIQGIDLQFQANPMPSNTVSFSVESAENHHFAYKIFDMSGKLLVQKVLGTQQGFFTEKPNLNNIASGQYFMMLQVDDKMLAKPFQVID
ncbi:MAG: phospholipase D-like domain-containing protein [Chitinophagales bacterium]|nr:hypothetical protein [Bacteroidota bacterium]MCB9042694.1 hypothetical protein [Chitinophagales bacterium]